MKWLIAVAGIPVLLEGGAATMTEESAFQLTLDVMNQLGPDRVQTLMFDELAVTYGLVGLMCVLRASIERNREILERLAR